MMTRAGLKRAESMMDSLEASGTAIINKWSGGKAVHEGASRFLGNEHIPLEDVSELVKERTIMSDAYEGHALVIQDTSEFNLNHINGQLKVNDPDVGTLSDDKSTGVLLHAGMAVSARTGMPLGVSGMSVWNRPFGRERLSEKDKVSRPFEDKESFKWVDIAEQSKKWGGTKGRLTFIGDRENDIYEYFLSVVDARSDILVRARHDRMTSSGESLSESLTAIPFEDGGTVDLKGNRERKARTAVLRIRWTKVELPRPSRTSRTLAERTELNLIEVLEDPSTVPPEDEAVHWRLLTSHSVDDIADASRIVGWYKWRWFIEDMFRLMKSEGLNVERVQLGTGMAIKKMIALCTGRAVRILALRQGRTGEFDHDPALMFSRKERMFLEQVNGQVEGRTKKQCNPFARSTFARCVWTIAVLGGWTPSDMSKRPPGVITLARGLKHFEQRYNGWKDAILFFQEISKNGS